jgi:hypothetical protein
MKTINKRVEDLENRGGPKPFLVLWGDRDNPDICRVDDDAEALEWDDAVERFSSDYYVICVRYVDDRRS